MSCPVPLSISRVLPALVLFTNLFMVPPEVSRADEKAGQQFYEVRTYVLGEDGDEAALDVYFQDALIPALQRQNVGPIGAFEPTHSDATGVNAIFLVIPLNQLDQLETVGNELNNDQAYQAAASKYLNRPHDEAPYQRIQSEVLSSLKCWPRVKVPDGLIENPDRVFELRLYESATEKIAETKLEMFNSGEVPIFLDCDILPIFMGKCISGPHMPSMTYLTSYKNEAARLKAWEAFLEHPDWKTLKVVPKYLNTVSRIDKFVLQPKTYSQM